MIKELLEKRKRLHEDNVAVLVKVKKDGRDVMNPEEEAEYNSRDQAIEVISRNVDAWTKSEAIEKRLAEVEERKSQPSVPASNPVAQYSARLKQGAADWDLALRAWFLKPAADSKLTHAHLEAAERVELDLNARNILINFSRRAPRFGNIREWERDQQEQRAQTVTTTGGGYTIPDEMMAELEKALLWFGGMRQAARVVRTESGADMPWPTANDTGQVGMILDINTQVSNQDVTFGQLVLKAFKYSSKQVLVPIELMQDSAVNLPQMLGEMLGERIGRIQNQHFTTGGGTTLPMGIVTAATSGLAPTGTVAGGFTYPNFVDLEHSVDIAYRRQGASWMMNDVVVARLKKLLDTTNRPIWQPYMEAGMNSFVGGGSAGTPGTLLGYPVVVNNDMSALTTTGTRAVLFGNLAKYLVRDVLSIQFTRLDERYADFHQVAFLAVARADGNLLNAGTNPVKYMAYTT